MDFKKIVLYFALAIIGLMLWDKWQLTQQKTAVTTQQQGAAAIAKSTHIVPSISPAAKSEAQEALSNKDHALKIPAERLIRVHTDTMNVAIDLLGGSIVSVDLPHYPKSLTTPTHPLELLTHAPEQKYITQTGITGPTGPDTADKLALYHAEKQEYQLENGENILLVNLTWENPQGLQVTKTFKFQRHKYIVNMTSTIENLTQQPWEGYSYAQLMRKEVKQESHWFQVNPFVGAAVSTPENTFTKYTFSKLKDKNIDLQAQGGWVAMMQHYFVSALIPNPKEPSQFYSHVGDDIYTIGFYGPKIAIAPGNWASVTTTFYAGPEVNEYLNEAAPHLHLTIDYGWLWPISIALFWIMKFFYTHILANWGWAIIFVTVLIKALFYSLSAKSYKAMAQMRKLQPKILALREQCGDDRQKLSQETIALYRKEKVNPLSGCMPILVQIPVFIALYWVLLESVELRHAPFIGWIKDLSAPDPFFILPIIMGISMLIQQKLSPAPADPMQAKVMMFLPVVFTILFVMFPAGLVLYWVVNNILSLTQQWFITRRFESHATS